MIKQLFRNRKKAIPMTEGAIWKCILWFCIPMIMGNFIQQLYSTVDAIIVGKAIGSTGLAAIGACNPIVGLIVGSLTGVATGASIFISQLFGKNDEEGMVQAVYSAILLSGVLGLFLMIIGILFVPIVLKVMETPKNIYYVEKQYLMIYFCGILFVSVYNMAAAIIRSWGDSASTFIYLLISSILNIVLDLVFVFAFKWGISGVAFATVISQFVSCNCALFKVIKVVKIHRNLIKKEICLLHWKNMLSAGLSIGGQNFVRSIANMILQTFINMLGAMAVAGYAAYIKIDDINWLPAMSLGMAMTIFTGQNIGAGKSERIKKGMITGIIMGGIYTAITAVVLIVFEKFWLSLFTNDKEVIFYGIQSIRWFSPYYWMYTAFQIITGVMSGCGKVFQSTVIYIFSICIFRIIWVLLVCGSTMTYSGIMSSYPVSWGMGLIISLLYIGKSNLGVNER